MNNRAGYYREDGESVKDTLSELSATAGVRQCTRAYSYTRRKYKPEAARDPRSLSPGVDTFPTSADGARTSVSTISLAALTEHYMYEKFTVCIIETTVRIK